MVFTGCKVPGICSSHGLPPPMELQQPIFSDEAVRAAVAKESLQQLVPAAPERSRDWKERSVTAVVHGVTTAWK